MAQLWSCPVRARDRWRGGREAGCAGGGQAGGARAWPAGEVLVEVFFYLGCLGPAFECLEVLFSRCFLAHAGSVYKQRLKAEPLGAAQLLAQGQRGRRRALAATAPNCYGVRGPGSPLGRNFPLPCRGATVSPVVNKSLKCLLFLSPPLLPASSFLLLFIPVAAGGSGLPSCPCWRSLAAGGVGTEPSPAPRPAVLQRGEHVEPRCWLCWQLSACWWLQPCLG